MSANGPKSLPAIGFLTVIEHERHGLFGGYLVLNAASRPLEFHCTAPVKPNRAQEILYGPTLRSYLYGEQIGQTLLAKAKIEPLLVCTDVESGLAVRDFVSLPVVLVLPQQPHSAELPYPVRIDNGHATAPGPKSASLVTFQLGCQSLAVSTSHETDRQLVQDRWQPYAGGIDLAEPFDRIREAIEEAQRDSLRKK